VNRFELVAALDRLATGEQGRGYGYADGQFPWRYDPAIDQPRLAITQLLEALCEARLRGTYAVIGPDRHGGIARALGLLGARVVGEGDEARGCDLVLLLGAESYEAARSLWQRHAPRVRPGGVCAIADQSQACPALGRRFDVDRFAHDLERDGLRPHGVRVLRFGGAPAIHAYVQTEATARVAALPWPAGFTPTPVPRRHGELLGFTLFEDERGAVAVRGAVDRLDARALQRGEHSAVLRAPALPPLAALVEAFAAAAPRLAAARAQLAAGRAREAAGLAAAVAADLPGLREALLPSLEAAPHSQELLLAAGTTALFGGRAREGAALLRRALRHDMLDRELLQAVAAAYLDVLGDGEAARALLADCKRSVRRQQIAAACHERLSGNVLWEYPQLLLDVRGVVQVGAHAGEEAAAFELLDLPRQVLIEPHPRAFAELERRCAGRAGLTLLQCALGAEPGERELRFGADPARASFLATHALAAVAPEHVQTQRLRVPVTTLDALLAEGRIDPAHCDLLMIDTEGTELDVLRGGRALLRQVDVVCVAVCLLPIYDGAPLLQQIQTFLREVDERGFHLRAFAPGPDPARGDAVFRRARRRSRP
jgi:FkbM family methyltransferase